MLSKSEFRDGRDSVQRANEEERCCAWLMQCREQRARAVHVAPRRISSIDQIPRPVIQMGRIMRRTKHDNQSKAGAFGGRQCVDNVQHVVAAARKSIECGNGRVAIKLSHGHLSLRTVRAGRTCHIQHLPDIAFAARVFERRRFVQRSARPITSGIVPGNAP